MTTNTNQFSFDWCHWSRFLPLCSSMAVLQTILDNGWTRCSAPYVLKFVAQCHLPWIL